MLKIIDFAPHHIDQAGRIARALYDRQRRLIPSLPEAAALPDLSSLAGNGLGVCAFYEEELAGFLCVLPPFHHAFGSTDAVGVFSPLGANGVSPEMPCAILGRLYQAAAQKWALAGASSHAICLYDCERAGQAELFRLGFGMRCADAVRSLDRRMPAALKGFDLFELAPDEFDRVLPLVHQLEDALAESPTFIRRPGQSKPGFTRQALEAGARFFAAGTPDGLAAFLRIEPGGETFIKETPGYLHITGAFTLPAHRGSGLSAALVDFASRALCVQGYSRLGVDYECINPSAARFWSKHFDVYTCALARRIDEHALRA